MNPSLKPDLITGRILVAVDGSEHSLRAVSWAARQAALEKRALAVVSAAEDTSSVAEAAAQEAVAAARADRPDLSVQSQVVAGDPRQVLIDASEHTSMLVMGSRGRGAVKSILLGSVSAAVSSHAACPVVICRPTDDSQIQAGVVVGADGTPESRPVIEFAYRQAALLDVPLTVLHSFWDAVAAVAHYREARGETDLEPDLEDLKSTLSQSVAGLEEMYPGVDVTLTLRHGFADEALSPRHGGWDLIVVGHHPMTSLARILTRSVASTVVERAHCTVAVVPQAPPRH